MGVGVWDAREFSHLLDNSDSRLSKKTQFLAKGLNRTSNDGDDGGNRTGLLRLDSHFFYKIHSLLSFILH